MVGGVLNVNSVGTLRISAGYVYTPNYGNKWLWFYWGLYDYEESYLPYWSINRWNIGISNPNTRLLFFPDTIHFRSFCIEIK